MPFCHVTCPRTHAHPIRLLLHRLRLLLRRRRLHKSQHQPGARPMLYTHSSWNVTGRSRGWRMAKASTNPSKTSLRSPSSHRLRPAIPPSRKPALIAAAAHVAGASDSPAWQARKLHEQFCLAGLFDLVTLANHRACPSQTG